MSFLFKICVISIIVKCMVGEPQCLSSNRNVRFCQDWKNMSVFVADMVGQFTVNSNKVNTKSNMLTLLIRAASGVIGRGTNALRTLIVNGLMLLTQTILTISDYKIFNYSGTSNQNMKFFPRDRPIDWILNNPYIKSMKGEATDETLADRLGQQLAPGMPCVQLLMCRLSPIIRYMQRQVKETNYLSKSFEWTTWSVSDWQHINESTAKYCAEKLLNDCEDMIRHR